MKKSGKQLKLGDFNGYKVVCGTVDNKNAKSMYLNISSWLTPLKKGDIRYEMIINRLSKRIKRSTCDFLKNKCENKFYHKRSIIDLDIRKSGVKYGKKSFMNCEITLYKKNSKEKFNDPETKDIINNLVNSIIKEMDHFEYFKFGPK